MGTPSGFEPVAKCSFFDHPIMSFLLTITRVPQPFLHKRLTCSYTLGVFVLRSSKMSWGFTWGLPLLPFHQREGSGEEWDDPRVVRTVVVYVACSYRTSYLQILVQQVCVIMAMTVKMIPHKTRDVFKANIHRNVLEVGNRVRISGFSGTHVCSFTRKPYAV